LVLVAALRFDAMAEYGWLVLAFLVLALCASAVHLARSGRRSKQDAQRK
jgi:hypothetical protein